MVEKEKCSETDFYRIRQNFPAGLEVLFLSDRTKVERYQISLLVTVRFQQPSHLSEGRDTFYVYFISISLA